MGRRKVAKGEGGGRRRRGRRIEEAKEEGGRKRVKEGRRGERGG